MHVVCRSVQQVVSRERPRVRTTVQHGPQWINILSSTAQPHATTYNHFNLVSTGSDWLKLNEWRWYSCLHISTAWCNVAMHVTQRRFSNHCSLLLVVYAAVCVSRIVLLCVFVCGLSACVSRMYTTLLWTAWLAHMLGVCLCFDELRACVCVCM